MTITIFQYNHILNVVYPYINPMVLLIIIPIFYGYFIGNIPNMPPSSLAPRRLEVRHRALPGYVVDIATDAPGRRKGILQPVVNGG